MDRCKNAGWTKNKEDKNVLADDHNYFEDSNDYDVCLGDNWRGPYKDVQEDGPRQQWQNLKAGEHSRPVLTNLNLDWFRPILTK